MSSSLLLILIVVLWLFVLAPLVVNTRKPIRRTSDALGKTRVLHRGGDELATTRRRPSFTEADVRVTEEVDDSLETVDASVDDDFDVSDVLIDDTEDEATNPAVVDGDIVYELESAKPAEPESAVNPEDAGSEQSGESAESAGDTAAAEADSDEDENLVADADADTDAVSDEDTERDEAVSVKAEPVRADNSATEVSTDVRRQYVDADDLMFDEFADVSENAEDAEITGDDTAENAEAAEAADAEAESDAEAEESAEVGDSRDSGLPAATVTDVDDQLTEDDYAFAEKRRGRGGFDPVSDARYAETRFARRRRSVAGLAAFIAVTILIAAFVGGWTWWIPLLGVGLMAVYLVSLRRTVRAEQELRARRIRRMKMARLGVRHREDEELGIPQRLLRPGAVVVELDDEDPDFADLAYTDVQFDDDGYDDLPQERVS
ncbi:MAG: hypothetical protein Q4E11_07915 [Corynebacterium sp.]|uniref:divisome protein SepX/GlpR n=1 Tax=Corynebacterium sp. TaxID=1720 RepID=UPI0026DAB5BC|nr:gephyrin-like molybdotransferase receptor GlpR [Corynebacterium sp.]MDO5030490.1 hypothetical protein [Corynebacterium sp.]